MPSRFLPLGTIVPERQLAHDIENSSQELLKRHWKRMVQFGRNELGSLQNVKNFETNGVSKIYNAGEELCKIWIFKE